VARFSQHMLGHAMDFFIPDVPLEQIRFAGLRLQRGGVGFYPTSGSPFVHLDTGSIRHWPRMTHDQLARVFPDGRTVHVPTDGTPLKGYELARADIEKRGDGSEESLSKTKPGLFASLFKRGKSNDEEDEGASAPAVSEKPAPVIVAAAAPAKSAEPKSSEPKSSESVPMPRAKPGSTLQLASADMQIVQVGKSKPAVAAEAKPENPADIINARGFWGDAPATPKQATPSQVAAINARQVLASADPQSTASLQALAYAPAASSPVDRANIVAASAPIPRITRPVRSATAATTIDQVVAKGQQGQNQGQASVISTSARISAASNTNDVWMRVMMLAPSASTSMSATVLGDADMSLMSAHFQKPATAIAMGFSDDPQMGLTCDHFSGSATAPLTTQSFVLRTASLR
jgi:hypothetical protein